jgi:hypothetical protein
MRKWLLAASLLPGLLGLAGCTDVKTPAPSVRAAVAHSDGPRPELQPAPAAEQTPTEPKAITPQLAQVLVNDAATTETGRHPAGDANPVPPVREPEQTGNGNPNEPNRIDVHEPAPTPASAPGVIEPQEPNDSRTTESNAAEHPAHPTSPLATFYDRYAEILKTYVREDGRVEYGTLDRHRLELKPLLAALDELDPNVYQAWPREEKLAFWLNAYNLKMLEIITRNYPIQSSWWLRLTWPPSDIRHIKGLWTDYKFIVMDEEFTLSTVEQRYFHKTFDDPRVYLAIAYATRSGPALRREPYRGGSLDRQLNAQVRQFLAGPQGLQIDRHNMVVRLSAIFKPSWRGKEFVRRYGTDKKFKERDPETRAVLNFLTNYLSREDASFLEVENYTIAYTNFDWRLDDTAGGS